MESLIIASSLSRQLPLLVVDGLHNKAGGDSVQYKKKRSADLLQGDRLLTVHGAADREAGPQNLL